MSDLDIDKIIAEYRKLRLLETGSDFLTNRLFPSELQKAQVQQARTETHYKRKLMGLPLDDEDYEDAVNDDIDFPQPATNLLGHFARKVSDRLPSLKHFSGAGAVPKYIAPIVKGSRYGRLARIFGT